MLVPWKKNWQTRQHLKKQRHHFADKGLCSQSYGFSSSHVLLWELVHKESWGLKNWCSIIGVLGKTLESPLHCKEIKPGNAKGNQPWLFIGRTDAETPMLWPPDAKRWLIRKDPDVRKDLWQKEKGAAEDEMIRWHHWLNGYELSKVWEIAKDRKAWCATVHGVPESETLQELSYYSSNTLRVRVLSEF